ncbi:polygalacturonase-like [Cryptomeria japonica]|uniref:polygalacturonase-like n=1 Tax=Cryptomeria japonica TaxID=3369 RepID=UPI0025AD287B|nr:polygalacturonase-like [Cryptomeria japonica]
MTFFFPQAIQFNDVKGSALSGLKVTNSPQFRVTLTNCDSVQIVGITIQAPESSPNTDGIDMFQSTNIVIKDSTIGTAKFRVSRVMQSNRSWGDEAVADPLPPKDPFGKNDGHVPQWVFRGGKRVDTMISANLPHAGATDGFGDFSWGKQSQRDFPSSAYFQRFFRRQGNRGHNLRLKDQGGR